MPYEPYGFTNCSAAQGRPLSLRYLGHGPAKGGSFGDDIETQKPVHTYQNIERVLRAGGSGLDQILQMTSFVVDLGKNGAGYVAARKTIMTPITRTTSATIGISALMVPAASARGAVHRRGAET